MLKHRQELADKFVDKQTKIDVLDDGIGFVRLVDYMGSDASIVRAARVSYGAGTRTLREDVKLLKYLYDNQHMSPFEQVVLTYHIKLPIFVARQMVRHRTARLNEVSARYSEMKPEFWMPKQYEIREQKGRNKQGSEGILALESQDYEKWLKIQEDAFRHYERLLSLGVAREQARTILPVSTYTEWFWQCDLRNLIHFLKLRTDSHAQKEMQYYANAMLVLAEVVAPETCKMIFSQGDKIDE